MARLFLRKNDLTKNDKLPYFTLCLIPEGDDPDAEWKEVGVFWKAKSGNGYTGQMSNGAELDITKFQAFKPDPNYKKANQAD